MDPHDKRFRRGFAFPTHKKHCRRTVLSKAVGTAAVSSGGTSPGASERSGLSALVHPEHPAWREKRGAFGLRCPGMKEGCSGENVLERER